MNWEAIGAVGEILGAFAVVLTLLYLAVQVKYAKTATTDATRLNIANGIQAMLLAMSTDDTLRTSVYKAQGFEPFLSELSARLSVSVEEAARVDMYAAYWFWLHWGQYSSTTDESDLEELRNVMESYVDLPSLAYSWENSFVAKAALQPEFVNFVDKAMSDYRKTKI